MGSRPCRREKDSSFSEAENWCRREKATEEKRRGADDRAALPDLWSSLHISALLCVSLRETLRPPYTREDGAGRQGERLRQGFRQYPLAWSHQRWQTMAGDDDRPDPATNSMGSGHAGSVADLCKARWGTGRACARQPAGDEAEPRRPAVHHPGRRPDRPAGVHPRMPGRLRAEPLDRADRLGGPKVCPWTRAARPSPPDPTSGSVGHRGP